MGGLALEGMKCLRGEEIPALRAGAKRVLRGWSDLGDYESGGGAARLPLWMQNRDGGERFRQRVEVVDG